MTELEVYDEPGDGPDYVVQFKIKNGPLLRAMRMRGFKTAKQFSDASKVDLNALYGFLGLRKAPINKNGDWSPSALRMSKALRLPPDMLFPEQHLEKALAKSSGEFELTRDDAEAVLSVEPASAELEMQRRDMQHALTEVLSELLPRQERVLRLRFGLDDGTEKTYEQCGAAMGGVSRERVRQIEAAALRKLQHPSRLRKLVNAGGYGFAEFIPAKIPARFYEQREIEKAREEEQERLAVERRKQAKARPQSLPHYDNKFWGQTIGDLPLPHTVYTHRTCEHHTQMSFEVAEKFQRERPGKAYCYFCQRYCLVAEFVWFGTDEPIRKEAA